MKIKWTKNECLKAAKQCKTLKEFKEKYGRASNVSYEKGWIWEFNFLKRVKLTEPTYEECMEEAKKYNRRHIFALKARKFYEASKKHGWLEKMKWLTPKISDYVNGKEDLIYGYFFDDLNAVYIGRTIDRDSRDYQHKTQEKDSVYIFSKENNIKIPEMVIIEENLTIKEGQDREKYWIEFYKNKGKNVINKAKPGSLGGLYGVIYTNSKCLALARECKSKTEFMKKYPTAYKKSLKYGWINNYTWFERPISYKLKWTYENTVKESKKYKTGGEFRKHNKNAYEAALRNGWLEDYKWMEIRNTKIRNMTVEFYKDNLDFPISSGDCFSISKKQTIKRVLNVLKNFINKKNNVKINIEDRRKIFISNFIEFCKLENIDYNSILQIEVIQEMETFKVIVNKGENNNVKVLSIA